MCSLMQIIKADLNSSHSEFIREGLFILEQSVHLEEFANIVKDDEEISDLLMKYVEHESDYRIISQTLDALRMCAEKGMNDMITKLVNNGLIQIIIDAIEPHKSNTLQKVRTLG